MKFLQEILTYPLMPAKKIKFAFKYVSTTAAAATWEVYDVKVVANGEGGGSVTPEPGQETTNFL